MDAGQPLIIVGAGRSGSTILTRILDSHSEIQLFGETDFLVPRLWLEVWINRFWLNWPRQARGRVRSGVDPIPPLLPSELELARRRVGQLVSVFFFDLLGVKQDQGRFWGFKEPWNGSTAFTYGWEPYEVAFPRAYWIHLVRHPFDYSRSCAAWNNLPLSHRYLTNQLGEWVRMLNHNRQLKTCERYFEVRFEDLIATPAACLDPLFSALDLPIEPAVIQTIQTRVMESRENAHPADDITHLDTAAIQEVVDSVDGLGSLMAEFEYRAPMRLSLSRRDGTSISNIDLRNPEGEVVEGHTPRFQLESEFGELRQQVRVLAGELARMREDPAWLLGDKLYANRWFGSFLARLLGLHKRNKRA